MIERKKEEKKPIKFISFNQIQKELTKEQLRELAKEFRLILKPFDKDFAFEIKNLEEL